MEHSALNSFLLLIVLSVPMVWVMRRCNMPSLLGYLAVGLLVGPHAANWTPGGAALETLAEIGLVFLLFMIGLEFSLSRLWAMRRTVLGLGSVQVVLSTLLCGMTARFIGIDWRPALVIGVILALSSTAIVARQLGDQMELRTRHGQLSIGILLFQDLAVAPLIVIIPIVAAGGALTLPLIETTGKILLAFLLMYIMGRYLFQRFFQQIAASHSAELFTLATLTIALAAAWVTYQLDLSLAMGAFLAGLVLSETEYRRKIESDIRPFRDVLMGLFFISVGSQLNVATVYSEFPAVFLLALSLIAGKAIIITALTRLHGYSGRTAIRTGLLLGQGGEFGFALIIVALQSNMLTSAQSQPVIAAIVLSMLVAPVLIRFHQPLSTLLWPGRGKPAPGEEGVRELADSCAELRGHVIICGFGRIGQNLALFLRDRKIPYVALEVDQKLVQDAAGAGEPVFYGDSTQGQLLLQAGLERAKSIVITFDHTRTAQDIIRAVRAVRGDVPITSRCLHVQNMKQLLDSGATDVVPEDFESSMMLAGRVLEQLGTTPERTTTMVERARQDKYRRLMAVFHGEVDNEPPGTDTLMLHNVILPAHSFADGKTLGALTLRDWQVTVAALYRGSEKIADPGPDTRLQEGDSVVLRGTMAQTQQAEKHLLTGPRLLTGPQQQQQPKTGRQDGGDAPRRDKPR